MAKTLSNRLKGILSEVISESQRAFILGKLITDNTIIAFEMCHHIKRKRQGKKGVVAKKTDMSNAYMLEWQFFREMMLQLGFKTTGVDLIMQCVCSEQLL